MNLDDLQAIKKIDTQDMLGSIDNLPGQLEEAWKAGQSFPCRIRFARQSGS